MGLDEIRSLRRFNTPCRKYICASRMFLDERAMRVASRSAKVVHRVTNELPDVLELVLAKLPWADLLDARFVCRTWRAAASMDKAWKQHCEELLFDPVVRYHVNVRPWDIGAVPVHAKALFQAGKFRTAFRETIADQTRTWLTRDELVGLKWSFRFKRDAGMQNIDPWWQGGNAMLNVFATDGTCGLEEVEGDAPRMPKTPHRWAFANDVYGESQILFDPEKEKHMMLMKNARGHPTSVWAPEHAKSLTFDPEDTHYRQIPGMGSSTCNLVCRRSPPGFSVGSVIKVFPESGDDAHDDEYPVTYPSQIVRRHTATFGWIMESVWTVSTSFPMARFADDKKNRVDLQDRYLQIGFEEQHVEVGNYHDFPHTRGAHLRRAEFCPTEFVEKTQEKKTVRFVSDRGDDESTTVQIPASLAHWVMTRPWNSGLVFSDAERSSALDECDPLVKELHEKRLSEFHEELDRRKSKKRKRTEHL